MERVKGYRNLKFRDEVVYSIQGSDGRVKGYQNVVLLKDGRFIVREAGRQRVLREGRKNVHAFADGVSVRSVPKSGWVQVRYNPYLFSTFVLASNEAPIASADYIRLDAEGAWAIAPRDESGNIVSGKAGRLFGRTHGMVLDESALWNG